MCEHSSVAQISALRREARRRKILENSTSRLKLIEGVNSSPDNTSFETSLEPKPKPEVRTTECKEENDVLSNDSAKASTLNNLLQENEDLEIPDFSMQDSKEEEDVIREVDLKGKNFIEIFLEKRLHYVLLALTVNILLFFKAGYLFYENIFCPFYTVKTIEIISRGIDKENSYLFLFMSRLPKPVYKFLQIYLTILLPLFSDLCMYLFTFVIGAKIINEYNM